MLRRVLKKVSSVIAALFLMVVAFVTSVPTSELAYAAVMENDLDSTSVESDLGEDFNWLLYPENKLGKIDVLQFVEYCYTDDVSEKGNYGLYLYVYNPALLRFSANNNVVNMAVAYDENGTPIEYSNVSLILCGYSHGDYAFRVYKFRISLPASVYVNAKTSNEKNGYRQYDIASIQLRAVGQALSEDNTVARSFRCSGYAKGCDETSMNESTYACTWENIETLSLDVKSTYYKPAGTNGKDDYTQDCLYSVYFAVPNAMISEYGSMSAIHATWLNAVLKPGLVTGNQEAFNYFNNFLGVDISGSDSGAGSGDGGGGGGFSPDPSESEDCFMYLGAYSRELIYQSGSYLHNHGYSYGLTDGDAVNFLNHIHSGEKIDTLYLNFYTDGGTDSADHYVLSSEEILSVMKSSLTDYGGDAVNGKYSEYIFESIDSEFTDINIKADESFSLTSQVISSTFWEKVFGINKYESTVYDGIKAIYPVSASDLQGTVEEISNRLYISQSDYADFLAFYTTQTLLDKTVYLFRYQVSDYVAQEASLLDLNTRFWDVIDTNAYFFKMAVSLDFDIIDVSFSKDGNYTVIPVISNPIDIVPDGTPPIQTTSDDNPDWWKLLLGLLVLGFIVFAVISWGPPLLISFFKMIGKGISTFFRKIGQALKRLFGRRR